MKREFFSKYLIEATRVGSDGKKTVFTGMNIYFILRGDYHEFRIMKDVRWPKRKQKQYPVYVCQSYEKLYYGINDICKQEGLHLLAHHTEIVSRLLPAESKSA